MGCLGRGLIGLVVVGGLLLVGGDFAAKAVAEREVEERLQSSTEISGATDVQIHGFPFLLQLARKKFDEVDISGGEVGTSELRLTRFDSTLNGVRPSSDGSSARVDAMDGTAFVSYPDLQQAVNRPGVAISGGSGNQIRVSGSITVLGNTFDATTLSRISVVDGNQLSVRATDIDVEGLPSSSDVTRVVGDRLNFVVPVEGLPDGLRLVDVQVGQDGVTARVQGQDVLLQS
jgi:hypothetical protein